MALVHLAIGLALVEFLVFGWAVGRARVTHGVPAPATTGHAVFERFFRVQMNTLEQLVIFVPSILLFAHYVSPYVAALLGALFIIGRAVYFVGYTRAAESRHTGFLLSIVPNAILLLRRDRGRGARAVLGGQAQAGERGRRSSATASGTRDTATMHRVTTPKFCFTSGMLPNR